MPRRARLVAAAGRPDAGSSSRKGSVNKRIARTLEISPETAKSRIKRIFSKLAVTTRTEAVFRADPFGCFDARPRRSQQRTADPPRCPDGPDSNPTTIHVSAG
jgi:hypothetical protein